jgi:hypothetical protein
MDNLKTKVTQLNKLLKSVNKLSLKDITLINLLVELIDNNYVFDKTQFGMFIDQICYKNGKLPCYLVWKDEIPIKIITYMITQNNVTNEQVTKLCYAIIVSNSGHYIINILFDKKYNFTIEHFKLLIQLNGYNKTAQINNYTFLHNNVIFSACLDIIQCRHEAWTNLDNCILLIEQNLEPFNIEHLEIILCCLSMGKHTMIKYNALNILLDNLKIIDSDKNAIIQFIMGYKYNGLYKLYNVVITYIVNKFEYDTIFAEYICENILKHNPHIILDLMLKGHKITTCNINTILEINNCILLKYDIKFESIGLSVKYFTNHTTINTCSIGVINFFEIFNVNPNIDTLNILCEKGGNTNVNILLQQYNVIPDKSTLDICAIKQNYGLIKTIINYKITPDKNTLYNLVPTPTLNVTITTKPDYTDIIKIIELFIEHGLVINIDTFTYLALRGIFLENLERFDIKYDEKLYFLCYLNENIYKYGNNFTVNNNILELHKFCSKNTLTYDKVISFLKLNNVKLDRFALDLIYNNIPSLGAKFTQTDNCMPSILTLSKRFSLGAYNGSLKLHVSPEYLVNNYKLTATDMFEPYDIQF